MKNRKNWIQLLVCLGQLLISNGFKVPAFGKVLSYKSDGVFTGYHFPMKSMYWQNINYISVPLSYNNQ